MERSTTRTLRKESEEFKKRLKSKDDVNQAGDKAHMKRLESILQNTVPLLSQIVMASHKSFEEDVMNLFVG